MYQKLNLMILWAMILLLLGLMSLLMSLYFMMMKFNMLVELDLITLNSVSVEMVLNIDWMSLFFFFCVMFISSMVIFYSKSYMEGEIFMNRFLFLVLLFVLSMVLMIFSLNLISILLGWDGLGLVSFCLVIYYQNSKSLNSGMLTILSNRVGDALFLLCISFYFNYGSWNFLIYSKISILEENLVNMIMLMIVLAAMTKSAQIPFAAWLPAAMAAPTPISALVHSSTLVTAGVYLLIRFIDLDSMNLVLMMLLIMSSMTMLMAGLSANFEFDLKKIIALSTLSQLGLMMAILCLGFKNMAFFHLCSHAMFKSLLFMCAGMVIHNMKDWQDIRLMGGIGYFMPMLVIYLNVSNLALCGMPFLAGFYSKDLILEMVLFSNFNLIIFFFFFFSTGLTVSYTIRLIYLNLFKEFNLNVYYCLNNNDFIMMSSMFLLMIMSVVGGSMMMWLILPEFYFIYLKFMIKMIIMMVMLMGLFMGNLVIKLNMIIQKKLNLKVLFYLGLMWFIPNLSLFGINGYLLKFSTKIDKIMDLGWIEIFGSLNLYKYFMKLGILNYYMQMNFLKAFIYLFVLIYFMMILMN
uniref:NADH dehydrogenase subunit 5 n=1 Tax=Cheumatopsyche charites TaxID=1875285 RepID=UPI0022DCD95C|nr:NADH dehydrogenase subunit 5 [Cheumatopsyche charites]UZZ43838.1 NADH dehydrogenase subunit 5 [Cheumatopsyche charites]